jgi:hypothetical protein
LRSGEAGEAGEARRLDFAVHVLTADQFPALMEMMLDSTAARWWRRKRGGGGK